MDASPHRRRNIGIALIIFPPACLFGSLILWAIVSFILNSMVMSGNGFGSPEFYRLLNVLFGFLGKSVVWFKYEKANGAFFFFYV